MSVLLKEGDLVLPYGGFPCNGENVKCPKAMAVVQVIQTHTGWFSNARLRCPECKAVATDDITIPAERLVKRASD